MLISAIQVESFRGVRKARIELGPGLNVLHGPNELGKSSLAIAIRAALTLPHGSSEARDFVGWGSDAVPRVMLEFESADVHWRVSKAFASGSRGKSILQRLKGSEAFEEAKGRNVDGKLREILAWGIPSPGGRGAPKGMPQSYLANALLGKQDEVTKILSANIEADKTESGKQLITDALGVLGRDATVTRILKTLEDRNSRVFTATGQLKRTDDSPLVQRTREIERHENHVRDLIDRAHKSAAVQQAVKELTVEEDELRQKCSQLEHHVELARSVVNHREKLVQLQEAQDAATKKRQVLTELNKQLAELDQRAGIADQDRQSTDKDLRSARERLSRAAAHRDNLQDSAEKDRNARRVTLEGRRSATSKRIADATALAEAQKEVEKLQLEHDKVELSLKEARQTADKTLKLKELAHLQHQLQEAAHLLETKRVSEADFKRVEGEFSKAKSTLGDLKKELHEKCQELSALAVRGQKIKEAKLNRDQLRAALMNAQQVERQLEADTRQVRSAEQSGQRLAKAQSQLTQLSAEKDNLDSKLSSLDAERREHESISNRHRLVAIVMSCLSLVAILSGVIWQQMLGPMGVVFVGFAATAAAYFMLAGKRKKSLASVLSEQTTLQGQRTEVSTKIVVGEAQLESSQREHDNATAAFGDLQAAREDKTQQLSKAREHTCSVQEELDICEAEFTRISETTNQDQDRVEQRCAELETSISELEDRLGCLRNDSAEAKVRADAAAANCVIMDLSDLEEKVALARESLGFGPDISLEVNEVNQQLEQANEVVSELETSLTIASSRLADAEKRHTELAAKAEGDAQETLVSATSVLKEIEEALTRIDESVAEDMTAALALVDQTQKEIQTLEEKLREAEAHLKETTTERDRIRGERDRERGQLEQMSQVVREEEVEASKAAVAAAALDWQKVVPETEPTAAELDRLEHELKVARLQLRNKNDELQKNRGQLEVSGGSVLDERLAQEEEVLEQLRETAEDLEMECRATHYLQQVLQEADEEHATHLGRSLAQPVMTQFVRLTGNRYSDLNLDAGLSVKTVNAQGGARDQEVLSVGTRDQLATIVRLALAAHLKSTVLLDDQLVHSDHQRLEWFREMLLGSIRDHSHQVIVMTCRPRDYLLAEELNGESMGRFESDGVEITVVDLEQVLSREGNAIDLPHPSWRD